MTTDAKMIALRFLMKLEKRRKECALLQDQDRRKPGNGLDASGVSVNVVYTYSDREKAGRFPQNHLLSEKIVSR